MKFRDVMLVLAVMFVFIILGTIGAMVRSIMGNFKTLLLLVLFVGQVIAQDRITPAQAVAMAGRDMSLLGNIDKSDVRYLTLYNIPGNNRSDVIQVTNGHINGLS